MFSMEEDEKYIDIEIEDLLEITLSSPDDFLKIKETLTRIGVSSQKDKKLWQSCLPSYALIETEDGVKRISEIVSSQYTGKVLSMDTTTGKFVWKNVVAHHKRKNKDKSWVSLNTTGNFSRGRLTCTSDHLIGVISDIFNPKIEFVQAKDTVGKYLVKTTYKRNSKRNNSNPIFTKEQLSILVGTLMGDACITKNGTVQIFHCLKQTEYLASIQSILGGRIEENKYQPGNVLYIPSNEQTKILRSMAYECKKTVKNIIKYIDNISLAYWYMDDGNLSVGKYAILNTQGFSHEDHLNLVDMFKTTFGIEPKIDNYNLTYNGVIKNYNRLRLRLEDSNKFFGMISKYVPLSMEYKLPEQFRSGEKHTNQEEKLEYGVLQVLSLTNLNANSMLYDIEVEDTHNFIADKSLVHNCHILHKRGKYYIVHFKEMFALDQLPTSISDEDIERRNTIAALLEEWNLLKIVKPEASQPRASLNKIKILSHKDKGDWSLEPKYHMGKGKRI